MVSEVTPLVLTFNEAPNIERSVASLSWAKEILVVDSFSTDDTLAILRNFHNVRVIQRQFDTFAGQCNFGIAQIKTDWILSLDADYVLTPELVAEIIALNSLEDVAGFQVCFRYCIYGRRLRGSLYPPRVVLYRKDKARYVDVGHGHRVQIEGLIRRLKGTIDHDDRKSFGRWISEQDKYMVREVHYLLQTPLDQLSAADRLRRWIVPAPYVVFFYTLMYKRLILDGWAGWFYVCQRTFAELLLSLRLCEARLRRSNPEGSNHNLDAR